MDEMMERLKRGERDKRRQSSSDDRELITRDDGTQGIKVRRRKRRTKRPQQEVKKISAKVKWGIFGSVLLLGLILLVAQLLL